MTTLEQLENKIRQSIPELKEEYEVFQEGAIDFDIITPIMLNHVLDYSQNFNAGWFVVSFRTLKFMIKKTQFSWSLKSAYLKDQSEELITFLNELK